MSNTTHTTKAITSDSTAKTPVMATDQEGPTFLEDSDPVQEVPAHVHTANASALFDLQPGETVAQAAVRKAAEG